MVNTFAKVYVGIIAVHKLMGVRKCWLGQSSMWLYPFNKISFAHLLNINVCIVIEKKVNIFFKPVYFLASHASKNFAPGNNITICDNCV